MRHRAPEIGLFSHVVILGNPPRFGWVVDVEPRWIDSYRPIKLWVQLLDTDQLECVLVRRSRLALTNVPQR